MAIKQRRLRLWAATLILSMPASAMAADGLGTPAGTPELDELIAIARQMNPDLQAAALEADAAAAKIQGADSLPDPKIQWQVQQWPTVNSGVLPRSPFLGDNMYTVSQMFPLWGKLDLRREVALAGARQASLLRQEVENEVVARLKIEFARYRSAYLVADLDRGLRDRMDTLAKLALARYARGLGKQEDATRAEVEKTRLETEISQTDAVRDQARVAINRLLDRDTGTPLTEKPHRRTVPAPAALDLEALSALAQKANPQILAQDAAIEGADKTADLAVKDWYPDVEVGFGPEAMGTRFVGYNAMVSITVPLERDLHLSKIAEAKAKAMATRDRREAVAKDVDKALADAWISLKSLHEVERLLNDSQLPQADIGFKAVVNGYSLGNTNFVDVLTAEQQLWKTDIDLIKVQFDEEARLAEIEKLAGGKL